MTTESSGAAESPTDSAGASPIAETSGEGMRSDSRESNGRVRNIAFASGVEARPASNREPLWHYEGVSPEPEHAFDRIAQLAAHILRAPGALITLVDDDRLWFKSAVGIDGQLCSIESSFCIKAIESGQVVIAPDTTQDERFSDLSFVTGPPHIRFYAGAPLIVNGGEPVGSICVMDTKPRHHIPPDARKHLADLAEIVVDELELRREIQRGEEREEELREARNNAESANEALSSFFAGITHDLRTPLTRMLLFTDLLNRTLEDPEHNYIEKIRTAGTRMNMLISSLLELAELRSGRFSLDLDTVNVADIVTSACEGIELMSESDTDRLTLDVPSSSLYARADASALTRVIDNLVENAIKHTEPSDQIRVHLSSTRNAAEGRQTPDDRGFPAGDARSSDARSSNARSPDSEGSGSWLPGSVPQNGNDTLQALDVPTLADVEPHTPSETGRPGQREAEGDDSDRDASPDAHVRIDIADNGPGIPADLLESLFDPYTQGPKRETSDDQESSSGVGLGLAITSDLVRAMDGTIAVRTREGVGTCFTIYLPGIEAD